jgi:predicted RNA-binding protein YlqC (UPF0109 family)
MNAKQLVQYVALALVDNPHAVSINEIIGAQTTILELKVAKQDVGKIIGKQGRTADAIRTILISISAKTRRRISLEIIE